MVLGAFRPLTRVFVKLVQRMRENKGIHKHLTIFHFPQHNGIVERRNRTLLVIIRSMIVQTNLLISFYGYALITATYTLNRVLAVNF